MAGTMAASDAFIGQTVSDYRILAKLGEGGMGKVDRENDSDLASLRDHPRFHARLQGFSAPPNPSLNRQSSNGRKNWTRVVDGYISRGTRFRQK
jgi:hypothetical protein